MDISFSEQGICQQGIPTGLCSIMMAPWLRRQPVGVTKITCKRIHIGFWLFVSDGKLKIRVILKVSFLIWAKPAAPFDFCFVIGAVAAA